MSNNSIPSAKQQDYEVSCARWWALLSVCGLGILLGFIIAFPGIVSLIFTEYFKLEVKIVDWFTLTKAASQVVFTVPIGIYAIANPLKVKFWLLVTCLLFGVGFALITVAVFVKTLYWFIFIGMVLSGVADTIFRACVPLVAVSWFSENAQGSICGIAYACLATGTAVASVTSAVFLNITSNDGRVVIAVHAIIFANLACCVVGILLMLITWKFVLKHPPSPPSRAAADRWIKYTNSEDTLTLNQSTKRFLKEAKILVTDKTSVMFVLSFGIILSVLVMHFMMLPPLQDDQDSSALSSTRQKSYLLICVTLCNIVGSIFFGAVKDRIKSYKILAVIIGIPSLSSTAVMLIGYHMRSQITLYLSTSAYSLFFFSLLPLIVDFHKQHCYSAVHEVVQTVFLVIVWNVIAIIMSEMYRFSISKYGALAFYVANATFCFNAIILLAFINPRQNLPECEMKVDNTEETRLLK